MHRLTAHQSLPIPLESAWDFFSNPRNLAVITPPSLGFIIKTALPEKMYAGMFIVYRVSPILGIPTTWVTEITHLDEHKFFVDEMRVGPYAIWHHQHHFKAIGGGVEMTDIVDYKLPMGILGKALHPFLVKPRLEQIFSFRKIKLRELFGDLPGSSGSVSFS